MRLLAQVVQGLNVRSVKILLEMVIKDYNALHVLLLKILRVIAIIAMYVYLLANIPTAEIQLRV